MCNIGCHIIPKTIINQIMLDKILKLVQKHVDKRTYNVPPPIGLRLKQYQIGTGGCLSPPEKRHLLSLIDTIDFTKWELKVTDSCDGSSVKMWHDVLDITWMCFGCNSNLFKHAPFCHSSHSYRKQESNWNDSLMLNVVVSIFLS